MASASDASPPEPPDGAQPRPELAYGHSVRVSCAGAGYRRAVAAELRAGCLGGVFGRRRRLVVCLGVDADAAWLRLHGVAPGAHAQLDASTPAKQRCGVYAAAACVLVTARILIADLLNGIVDARAISRLVVAGAGSMDAATLFCVRVYRDRHAGAVVRGYSDDASAAFSPALPGDDGGFEVVSVDGGEYATVEAVEAVSSEDMATIATELRGAMDCAVRPLLALGGDAGAVLRKALEAGLLSEHLERAVSAACAGGAPAVRAITQRGGATRAAKLWREVRTLRRLYSALWRVDASSFYAAARETQQRRELDCVATDGFDRLVAAARKRLGGDEGFHGSDAGGLQDVGGFHNFGGAPFLTCPKWRCVSDLVGGQRGSPDARRCVVILVSDDTCAAELDDLLEGGVRAAGRARVATADDELLRAAIEASLWQVGPQSQQGPQPIVDLTASQPAAQRRTSSADEMLRAAIEASVTASQPAGKRRASSDEFRRAVELSKADDEDATLNFAVELSRADDDAAFVADYERAVALSMGPLPSEPPELRLAPAAAPCFIDLCSPPDDGAASPPENGAASPPDDGAPAPTAAPGGDRLRVTVVTRAEWRSRVDILEELQPQLIILHDALLPEFFRDAQAHAARCVESGGDACAVVCVEFSAERELRRATLDHEAAMLAGAADRRRLACGAPDGGAVADALAPGATVIVDTRELRSLLPLALHRRGFVVRVETLAVGDYVLSATCAVERKAVSTCDLSGSLDSGRLFKQLQSLTRAYAQPVVLIEFDDGVESLGGRYDDDLSMRNVQTKLTKLMMEFPTARFVWAGSPTHTADLFAALKAGNAHEPDAGTARALGAAHDDESHADDSLLLLSKLPGVDRAGVVALSKAAASIKDLAALDELQLAALIGPKKAKELIAFLWHDHRQADHRQADHHQADVAPEAPPAPASLRDRSNLADARRRLQQTILKPAGAERPPGLAL
ncbi:hypothetical protein M885DRAFT_584633 [Pelagophyceae sp. CCMP2097]|nr:hypothetical protein M885DRAFT_584633 [Pelagophyceae sp. CCMP2097]